MNMKKSVRRFVKDAYLWYCANVLGVQKNKVVFVSFNGKSYSDNPKAISEALHRECPEAQIVWLFTDPDKKKAIVPPYVKVADMSSVMTYNKELCTCKVLVTNFLLPKIKKSKKQFFIQTWHGDRGFKKILRDATHPNICEQEEGYCDLAVAGSLFGERLYRTAFGYTGNVLTVGTPRDDRYLDPSTEEIAALRQQIGVPAGKKILLYAPTLRDQARDAGEKQKTQDVDISRTLDALEEKYGDQWVCLVRAHPGVIGLSGIEYSDRIMDVSAYEDMGDLLLISDMLITDYSSCAADFPLLNRPVILFQSDIQEYSQNTRALYFAMSESPYYVAEDQQSLEKLIENLNEDNIQKNCKAILDFYETRECGTSAVEVAKIIAKQLGE